MAGTSVPVTTEGFGTVLDGRYGGPGQQNEHIDYFFIRLSHPVANNVHKLGLEVPDAIAHDTNYVRKWPLADKDWPGMFVDIFPKDGRESEREREDRLNKHTRNVVIGQLKAQAGQQGYRYTPDDVHVMFYRACKYTN